MDCPKQEEGSEQGRELMEEADSQMQGLERMLRDWKLKTLLSGPYDESVSWERSHHLSVKTLWVETVAKPIPLQFGKQTILYSRLQPFAGKMFFIFSRCTRQYGNESASEFSLSPKVFFFPFVRAWLQPGIRNHA
eukprot:scaffold62178_cov27-Prasinocladus_malaysianus.AAC.1